MSSTPLTDGGRVEATWNGGGVRLQKYDASGVAVGDEYVSTYNSNQAPQVVALSNGGYAVLVGFVFKGAEYPIFVFDGAGRQVAAVEAAGFGIGATIEASPEGGFLVASMEKEPPNGTPNVDLSWRPLLTLYDNAGAVVGGPVQLTGDLPTLSVQADGDYLVHWQDGDTMRSLEVDPTNPQSLQPGATDAAGRELYSGQYADTLQGGPGDDILHAGRGPDLLTGNGGADAFAFGELPWNAGHVTDFTVGTDRLDISALLQASGYAGADPVADGWVRFDPDGAGGTKVYLDTNGPAAGGDWPWLITTLDGVSVTTWAQVAGGAAASSPSSGAEQGQVLTSDQYADALQGGTGDDTLHAGQGPDMLTGAAGADRFVWGDFPWNAGHVTDFTPGVDKLDLSALFAASTYIGSDPVGDGRLEFRPDGQGNTQVYLDRDDLNGGDWPFLITTLDGVSPGQIGPGDWLA